MSRTHQRWVFILLAVIAVVLAAACQPAATPTPTPRPTATAVPPTVAPTATSAVTTEATAMMVEPTEEMMPTEEMGMMPTEEMMSTEEMGMMPTEEMMSTEEMGMMPTEEMMSTAEMTAMAAPTEMATMEVMPEMTMEMTPEMTMEVAMTPSTPGTIIDVAKADGNFGTLLLALNKAGLTDLLNGKGPFTVFAPTNAAFAVLLSATNMTAHDLLGRTDLADILKYHVVPGKVTADDLMNYRTTDHPDQIIVPTLDGAQTLSLTFADDGTITINGTAMVTLRNVEASNGVIHVIDAVLMPPAPDMATAEAGMMMEMTPEATP